MSWVSVVTVLVGGVLVVCILAVSVVSVLFLPIRRFRLPKGVRTVWSGRVPYRIADIAGVPFLEVRGLPYPGSFRAETARRPRLSLDGTWSVRTDPADTGERSGWFRSSVATERWEPVSVPSTFNPAESPLVRYLGRVWYRRHFDLDGAVAGAEEGIRRLCFEGLLLRGKVWLNDVLLGEYEGGYTANYFDVSTVAREHNCLVVMTDNRLTHDSLPPKIKTPHNPGWHTYGGIHRSVYVESLPSDYCVFLRHAVTSAVRPDAGDVAITVEGLLHHVRDGARTRDGHIEGEVTPDRSPDTSGLSATLTLLRDGAEVSGTVCECAGRGGALSLWKGRLDVTDAVWWEPGRRATYTLVLTIRGEDEAIDEVRQVIGLRTVGVAGDEIHLNGKRVFLRGICKHEDHPRFGATQPPPIVTRDLELIRALGANYVRLAHYPHDPVALDAAEDAGFLLSEEVPLYQAGIGFTAWVQEKEPLRRFPARLFGIRQTRRRELFAHSVRQLAEMIVRDRHRPALIMWSVSNESYSLGRRGAAPFNRLVELSKYLDPTRLVTAVELTYNRPFFDRLRRGWEKVDVLSLNSYFGWYYGAAADLEAHLREIRTRWPDRPLILSEFGAGAAPGRTEADGVWRAERVHCGRTYSEEYQADLIEAYWNTARTTPWVCGLSPWVFADFYNIWFPNNPVPNYNLKGIVSKERIPKAAYHRLRNLYRTAGGSREAL